MENLRIKMLQDKIKKLEREIKMEELKDLKKQLQEFADVEDVVWGEVKIMKKIVEIFG